MCTPLFYGILNVTPDSFYDGGRHHSFRAGIAHAEMLIGEGADVIDIGGESTRPGADEIGTEEELKRVLPIVREVAKSHPVSIDTRNAAVARAALDLGATVVNDVSGLSDPDMIKVVREYDASLIIMHAQGTPKTMQANPCYDDVISEVRMFLETRIKSAENTGIAPAKIMIDPGIGFGKRLEDNLQLIRNIGTFRDLGKSIMVGISRKSFLKDLGAGDAADDRLAGSLAASVIAFNNGAQIFRTHDVAETRKALSVARHLLKGSSGA